MTDTEILNAFIAGGALLVSIVSIIVAVRANRKSGEIGQAANSIANNALTEAKKANLTSMGNLELVINERITTTKEKVSEMAVLMTPLIAKKKASKLKKEDEYMLESYKKVFNTALENNVNAYEEACMKYIDGKVDKVRFKKAFYSEIKQLVEDKNHKNFFDPVTSKYKAILKVYGEWCNLEK